jgi:hypothetical protein
MFFHTQFSCSSHAKESCQIILEDAILKRFYILKKNIRKSVDGGIVGYRYIRKNSL